MSWVKNKQNKVEEQSQLAEGKDLSLKEKVNEIYKFFHIAEKGKAKNKNEKLPLKVRNLAKKSKQNKLLALVLKRNTSIEVVEAQIKQGFVTVGNRFYDCSPKYIWRWKGKIPAAIIPEWDLQPIASSELFERTKENNTPSDPAQLIVRAFKSSEIKNLASGVNFKTWVWVGLAIIVVGYIIMG